MKNFLAEITIFSAQSFFAYHKVQTLNKYESEKYSNLTLALEWLEIAATLFFIPRTLNDFFTAVEATIQKIDIGYVEDEQLDEMLDLLRI